MYMYMRAHQWPNARQSHPPKKPCMRIGRARVKQSSGVALLARRLGHHRVAALDRPAQDDLRRRPPMAALVLLLLVTVAILNVSINIIMIN